MNNPDRSSPMSCADAHAAIERVARARPREAQATALARAHGRVLASDVAHRHGEDADTGRALATAGQLLSPARLALLADQGFETVEVVRPPTVAVFCSGDELVEPGLPLAPGQVYNSSRELLMGLLRGEGLEPVAWPTLPDQPGQIESALRHAGEAFDLVLTCGGLSAAGQGHLPALLQRRGRVHVQTVGLGPDIPVLLADGGTLGPALFLCLPSDPVAVLASFVALARPLLDGLQGRAPRPVWRARLAQSWNKHHAHRELVCGQLSCAEDGALLVRPDAADGPDRMHAAADADALIVLEEGARAYPAGSVVEVLPC